MFKYPLPQQSTLPSEHGNFKRNETKVQHTDVQIVTSRLANSSLHFALLNTVYKLRRTVNMYAHM